MNLLALIERHRNDPNPHPRLRVDLSQQQLSDIMAQVMANLPTVPDAAVMSPSAVTYGAPSSVGSSTRYARENHTHSLSLPSALVQLAGATAAGIAIALAPSHDAQKSLLGLANLSAVLSHQTYINGSFATGPRYFTLPDQNGTFAILEREQTFTARQWVSGNSLGVDVLPGAGLVAIGGGWIGCSEGITLSGGDPVTDPYGGPQKRTSVLFQPRTAWESGGLNFTWKNPPAPYGDGKLIAHVGVNGTAMDFSIDGLTGGLQFYTNTGPTSAMSCMKLLHTVTVQCSAYAAPSPASNTIEMGGGSLWAYNDIACNRYLGVGVSGYPTGNFFADFNHATRWMRISAADPGMAVPVGEVHIGGGRVSAGDAVYLSNNTANQYLFLKQDQGDNVSYVQSTGVLYNQGTYVRVTPTTGWMEVYGNKPNSPTSGSVNIGAGHIFGSSDTANGTCCLWISNVNSLGYGGFIRGGGGGAGSYSLAVADYAGSILFQVQDGMATVKGTAATSPAASAVNIGGGNIWSAADATIGTVGHGTINAWSIWGSNSSAVGNGCRLYLDDDVALTNPSGTDVMRWDHVSCAMVFTGSASASVASGEVKIGGGQLYAYTSVRADRTTIINNQIEVTGGDYDDWLILNYKGYNGGLTRYRSTLVYDGKQNILARFDAPNACATFYGSAPSAPSGGEVRVGGGTLWASTTIASKGSGLIGAHDNSAYVAIARYSSGYKYALINAGGTLADGSNYADCGLRFAVRDSGNNQVIAQLIESNGTSIFGGAAPSAVASGEVKIGGGNINTAGNVVASGYLNTAGGVYDKNTGNQIINSRKTGYAAMTGSANRGSAYDTSTVTLAQLAQRVMALQADLTSHGLIGA